MAWGIKTSGPLMVLRRPTADTRRVEVAANAKYHPTDLTVCGWVYMEARAASVDTLMDCFSTGVVGWFLRLNAGNVQFLYKASSGNGNRTHTPTKALALNEWRWLWASVDSAGAWQVGIDDEAPTTGTGNALDAVGGPIPLALGCDPDGSADNGLLGRMVDSRIYSRILSTVEATTIFDARGGDAVFDGLVGRFVVREGTIGRDTGDSLPANDVGTDTVTMAGTGDDYIWQGFDPWYELRNSAWNTGPNS